MGDRKLEEKICGGRKADTGWREKIEERLLEERPRPF